MFPARGRARRARSGGASLGGIPGRLRRWAPLGPGDTGVERESSKLHPEDVQI